MQSVTIREAQHNLARIIHQVEAGEVVEVLRRKSPVARIVPIDQAAGGGGTVDWDGHAESMNSVWGGGSIPAVDEVLDDLRGGR